MCQQDLLSVRRHGRERAKKRGRERRTDRHQGTTNQLGPHVSKCPQTRRHHPKACQKYRPLCPNPDLLRPAFNKPSAHWSLRSSGVGSGYRLGCVGYKADTLQEDKDQVPKGLECHAEGDRASVTDRGWAGSDASRLALFKAESGCSTERGLAGKVRIAGHRPRPEKQ